MRCKARRTTYDRGGRCEQSARESGYCGTHEKAMLRATRAKDRVETVADLLAALHEIAAIEKPQTCLDGGSIVGAPIVGWNYALIARRAIAKAEGR